MEKFLVVKDYMKTVRRYNLTARTVEFKIKPVPNGEEPVNWVRDAINQVIEAGTQNLQPEDQVSFSFCSKDFKRGDGWIRFRPAHELTTEDVWKVISDIYQSNSAGLNTDTFCLGVTTVKMPKGRGRRRNYNTFDEASSKQRGIVCINNRDNLCLPRALVVAITYATKDSQVAKVRKDRGKIQQQRAMQLVEDAQVTIPTEGCGIPELHKFQQHLSNHKITVYRYGTKGRDVIFSGAREGHPLNLLYHKGHFNVITSLTAAFCCNYYCEKCSVPYNNRNRHRCGGTCAACLQSPACPQAIKIICSNCHRSFRGQSCYDNHTKLGSYGKLSVCQNITMCERCWKVVKSGREHTCGEVYCKLCKQHVVNDHLCYMQPDIGKPKTENMCCLYSTIWRRGRRNSWKMEHISMSQICQRKIFKQIVVIAHNGQAFDHQFMLNYILTFTDLNPELIMRGTKIIMMGVGNVKFLDSLNYFPLSLSKLPQAFGLGDGFKKGYFPYLFNTAANTNYVGTLPPVEYYDPNNMKEDDRSGQPIQWLLLEEKQRKINLICAARQQEARVVGVKVDGYCPEANLVFEFHGCYFHGCQLCFKNGRDEPMEDDPTQTLNTRYETTVAKLERLRNFGYNVTEIWECEFKRQLQQNKELCSYDENHALLVSTPLNPREAFYGGRTGNTHEYYKCKYGEKIKYVDVCSLYPWVCKYGKFPIGHTKVYVGSECPSPNSVEGVIKCKILPPRDVYHPVLPAKIKNKLMFVLCRTCGEQMNQGSCNHEDDQDRALTGTWVADEVKKALEMGYRMVEVYEGLFTAMMNKFVAVKQQASGWPRQCRTDEEKDKYIEEFLEKEDVRLEFNEIVENPGLRSLAKLILNSFWGKLGQRENQPKTKIIRSPEEFFGMLTNPSIYVNAVLPINEDTLVVNWEHKEETYDPLATVNVVLAAYVTTQARLKLYSYLEKLGDRVLYYDTDSVIYTCREGDEYDVPTGEFLGDMTDELGAGSYITEFVSGGPKNYAYKYFDAKDNEEKVVCKVKGIALNYAASQLVNFDTIKKMILTPADPVYITSKNIRRTNEYEAVTRDETRMYKPLSMKKMLLGRSHFSTLRI
ncbi:hypothetical protein NQ315_014921 [Exocentrus adspersus]|uniref:DNA-directed DNA polymerase n=1 Tax=Exocentrus adspersus TaxID=1586481 RepID=A0AAV8V6X2_9CUCU|nr:hypothetical protein NQ315_014921 [Exocentrus adspersus]